MSGPVMIDIGLLLAGYQAAKDAFDRPISGATFAIDGEKLVVVVMHPAAYEQLSQITTKDPRSTWDGKVT